MLQIIKQLILDILGNSTIVIAMFIVMGIMLMVMAFMSIITVLLPFAIIGSVIFYIGYKIYNKLKI